MTRSRVLKSRLRSLTAHRRAVVELVRDTRRASVSPSSPMPAPIRGLSSWPKHPGTKVCRGMEIPVKRKAQTIVSVEFCEWRLHNNASRKQRTSQTIFTFRRNKRQKQISHYEGISHFEASEEDFISVINFSQFRSLFISSQKDSTVPQFVVALWMKP